MKTIIWIRPSGSEIELADTKNFKKLAKEQKWKRKKDDAPQLEMSESDD